MNLDTLDKNQASFVRAALAKWPEWRAFAIVEGEGGAATFRVHLPDPPGSRLASPLSVWVDDEVTVGMDTYHTHFAWPCEPDELAVELTDPIGFLQLLLDEQEAVLTYLRGDVFGVSSILTLKEYNAGKFRERPDSGVDGYRVRSWRGSPDQDGRYDR